MLVIRYHSFLKHPKRSFLSHIVSLRLFTCHCKRWRKHLGLYLIHSDDHFSATPYLTHFRDFLSYLLDEPNLVITGNGNKIPNSFPLGVLSRNGSLQVKNWSTFSLGHIVFSFVIRKTLLGKHKPHVLLSYMKFFIRKT